MVTTVWDADFVYSGPQSVRVSCHAGDYGQRAICNAIGDQPLFYMDECDEDDFMLDILSDGMMETMQSKLHHYDKAIESLSTFKMTTTESCFETSFMNPKTEQISIHDILEFGFQSGIFRDYHDYLVPNGLIFNLSDKVETAVFNNDDNCINVNPHLGVFKASVSLLRAMRTAWHATKGILINPLVFQPEEAVTMNRLFAADLDAIETGYMWDLKLAGCSEEWGMAMSGPDYDLLTAYAIEAMADFRSIKNGMAARAAFEKWFISDRCKNFDRRIIQTMLGHHATFEIENQATSRHLAHDIICKLGDQPQGKNYLSSIIPNLMSDSLYTDVRDRSNANFLWFVSFERRMAEMEQELQIADSEIHSDTNVTKDNVYELPTVIGTSTDDQTENTVATLFFLDHFRAG